MKSREFRIYIRKKVRYWLIIGFYHIALLKMELLVKKDAKLLLSELTLNHNQIAILIMNISIANSITLFALRGLKALL